MAHLSAVAARFTTSQESYKPAVFSEPKPELPSGASSPVKEHQVFSKEQQVYHPSTGDSPPTLRDFRRLSLEKVNSNFFGNLVKNLQQFNNK